MKITSTRSIQSTEWMLATKIMNEIRAWPAWKKRLVSIQVMQALAETEKPVAEEKRSQVATT